MTEIQKEVPITSDPQKFAAWVVATSLEPSHSVWLASDFNPSLYERETRPGALVTVRLNSKQKLRAVIVARPVGDGSILKILSHPDDWPAVEVLWKAIKADLKRDGLLTNSGRSKGVMPPARKPAKPKTRRLWDWFDYYHSMHAAGRKYTLPNIATEANYSKSYVKQQHLIYMAERKTEPTT